MIPGYRRVGPFLPLFSAGRSSRTSGDNIAAAQKACRGPQQLEPVGIPRLSGAFRVPCAPDIPQWRSVLLGTPPGPPVERTPKAAQVAQELLLGAIQLLYDHALLTVFVYQFVQGGERGLGRRACQAGVPLAGDGRCRQPGFIHETQPIVQVGDLNGLVRQHCLYLVALQPRSPM